MRKPLVKVIFFLLNITETFKIRSKVRLLKICFYDIAYPIIHNSC